MTMTLIILQACNLYLGKVKNLYVMHIKLNIITLKILGMPKLK